MAQAFHKFGRYLIVGEIAQGGMANIYHGKLVGVAGFEKDVAIKKILSYWSHQKEFIDMLIDEAKVLVHLNHNNIVQVIELGHENNNYFIVMEYVKGLDLKKILRQLAAEKQTLPLQHACYITRQICLGLEFAHSRLNQNGAALNIVHRDISPQNILVNTEGDVKITDFGIAKVMGKTSETATGVLKGKFSYMSPEQAIGQDIDLRTDIFALGALFYEMIFGKKAFDGRNDLEIIENVKNTNIYFDKNHSEELIYILKKALSKNPQDRYQTASDLRRAVETLEENLKIKSDSFLFKKFLLQNFSADFARKEISIEGFFANTHQNITAENTSENLTQIHAPENPESRAKIMAKIIVDKHTAISKKILIENLSENLNTNLDEITTQTQIENQTMIEPAPKRNTNPVHSSRALKIVFSACVFFSIIIFLFLWRVHPQKNEIFENTKTLSIQTQPIQPKIILPLPHLIQIWPALAANEDQTQKSEKLSSAHNLLIDKTIEPQPKKYGTVRISARPWGYATLTGLASHSVPAMFKAPTGTQILTVFNPPTHKTVSKKITISEGTILDCKALFGNVSDYIVCR